jgi:hypothetical protein
MNWNKVTKTVDSTGAATYAETTGTFMSAAIDAVLSPLKVFSSTGDVFVSESAQGMAALAYGIGGIVVGDRFGDKIPFIGEHRYK